MKPQVILVVEDDPNDEHLTLRALRGVPAHCSVVVARSGNDALDYLLRQGSFSERISSDPDLIFLDNTLPGVPGNELVSKIRAEENLRSVPLIVFSGSSDENLIARCLSAGANDFVEKPVDMVEYIDRMKTTASKWLSLL